jgi:hypothetical protein
MQYCGNSGCKRVRMAGSNPGVFKNQIIVWNFIIIFTRSNTCCIFKTSGKKYSEIWTPDNKKEIYFNEIVKKQHIYPTGTRSRSPARLGTARLQPSRKNTTRLE